MSFNRKENSRLRACRFYAASWRHLKESWSHESPRTSKRSRSSIYEPNSTSPSAAGVFPTRASNYSFIGSAVRLTSPHTDCRLGGISLVAPDGGLHFPAIIAFHRLATSRPPGKGIVATVSRSASLKSREHRNDCFSYSYPSNCRIKSPSQNLEYSRLRVETRCSCNHGQDLS